MNDALAITQIKMKIFKPIGISWYFSSIRASKISAGMIKPKENKFPIYTQRTKKAAKANTEIKLRKGSEVKVVYPQKNLNPDNFNVLDFKNFYIQPMDSENYEDNVSQSVKYCMQNPNWKLSLQTHKILGIR